MRRQTAAIGLVAAAVAGGAGTAVAFATPTGSAAAALVFRLEKGDSASVPGIGWTCVVARVPGRRNARLGLLCTSDRKPIRSVSIFGDRVVVDTGSAPVRLKGSTYRFRS